MMADSGARGSAQQMRQLAGMRGLMAKPSGEIIETPITSNFREGLSVLAVLHLDARRAQGSGRHGAQDRQLGLPDAAARRRRAGRDRSAMEDCGTDRGHRDRRRSSRAARSSSGIGERILGRVALEDVRDPINGEVLVRRPARRSTRTASQVIEDAGIEKVQIRSVLTCEVERRRVRDLLRARSRARRDGEPRRGGRRDRGAVDRRAGHAAHDADVPHRRHGDAARRSSRTTRRAAEGEVRLHEPAHGARPRGPRDRDEPQRRDRDLRRRAAASASATRWCTART